MSDLMKLLHVLTAFWFVSGLFGRTITMWLAARTPDIRMVKALVRLAGYFERLMVIPGSLAVLGFGLGAAWLRHWPVFGSLQGSPINWLFISTLLYLSMIPIVALVFIPRGKVFAQSLERAVAHGTVTADLQAAFHDRAVKIAHTYEFVMTVVVIVLMVTKPF